MQVKNVPNDAGKLEGEKELCYAVDENGKYVTVQSEGWSAKNTALDQAWDFINEQVQIALQKINCGEQSNLAYFMAINMMDIKLMSGYSGYSKRRIKKHLQPGIFEKLDQQVLQNYADIFRVSVEELISFRKEV